MSILDIIGPEMVGPSSSHTAGSLRLARVARSLLEGTPQRARVSLHGSFAKTYRGHGTDRAVAAGLLGFEPDDARIVGALYLARQAGLEVAFEEAELGEKLHPNTLRIEAVRDSESVDLWGSSVGGGFIEVFRLDGYPVSIGGEYHTLIVSADDVPGTVAAVTRLFSERGLNLAYMDVRRKRKGERALMVLQFDDPLAPEALAEIRAFPWLHGAHVVPQLVA
ncbi:MAG: L-serine ammonia-lyase, iron-sulfur-dependent subunit beta [Gemmatimonadota bacterium]